MKTPEQIADEMFSTDISLGQDDKPVIIAAINADRAQRSTIPTEDEWRASESMRLGVSEDELPDDEDWGNTRPVIVMWGDSIETPTQRLQRFHEEILAMHRENVEQRERWLTALDELRQEVAR